MKIRKKNRKKAVSKKKGTLTLKRKILVRLPKSSSSSKVLQAKFRRTRRKLRRIKKKSKKINKNKSLSKRKNKVKNITFKKIKKKKIIPVILKKKALKRRKVKKIGKSKKASFNRIKQTKAVKIIKIAASLPVKSSKTKTETKSSLSVESFKPKIKVIGIGGGGGSIVSEIGRSLEKATFVIADTDVRTFKKRRGIKYFLFGQELTHGLGTGLNTDLAMEAAHREREKISQFFEDQDIIIFIVCLGGGLGSGATQVFLDAAKDFSGITLGIFTLPFKFEGKSKHKIATKALKELRRSLSVSITIPNERIFKIIDENTAITDAFSMVNKNLIESLESLIDLIQSHGLINIDFADLRAILQGKGNLAFLNTAQASGEDKADKVIKDVLHNPLYQDNFVPEKVLFNIEGGKNLSMFDVDKISKAISEKNPKAKIIFGISKNQKYKNKIKTTLLMTGPTSFLEDAVDKQEAKGILTKRNFTKKINIKKAKVKRLKRKSQIQSGQKDKINEGRFSALENLIPAFGNMQFEPEEVKKISIAEKLQNTRSGVSVKTDYSRDTKKNIRRTALEIQKAEEFEKNKKTKQEKEWEIPAFLRFKKVK